MEDHYSTTAEEMEPDIADVRDGRYVGYPDAPASLQDYRPRGSGFSFGPDTRTFDCTIGRFTSFSMLQLYDGHLSLEVSVPEYGKVILLNDVPRPIRRPDDDSSFYAPLCGHEANTYVSLLKHATGPAAMAIGTGLTDHHVLYIGYGRPDIHPDDLRLLRPLLALTDYQLGKRGLRIRWHGMAEDGYYIDFGKC
ncbi:hypothetical protein [Alloyangia pacifica]|uniref:Uncharacterized protein n=1 Tax=Alloyangia pacifica TaxID=311180 RepID=A0A1I6PNY5_9RHOB|nr:hypothetical protein [Alloyangia pacifica]SDG32405.1 hypothetical protein SAMN04488245_102370 [Alloyangia pacifica]SFS41904.1 hypothetical protein SAMN04488050_101671 [Alloyangia pacifica]